MIIGIVLLVSGLVIPIILKPIFFLWMVFASILGFIMTRVILSLLFFIILTPIGLILRLFGKQLLLFEEDLTKESYWNKRTVESFSQTNYEKQF